MGISLEELSNTLIPFSLSPTLEQTVTSDLFLVLKHQFLQLTQGETVLRSAEFLSLILGDDVLNSEHQIQLATHTWHSLLSCKLVWTELRTKSTLVIHVILTFMKLLLKNWQSWALRESLQH